MDAIEKKLNELNNRIITDTITAAEVFRIYDEELAKPMKDDITSFREWLDIDFVRKNIQEFVDRDDNITDVLEYIEFEVEKISDVKKLFELNVSPIDVFRAVISSSLWLDLQANTDEFFTMLAMIKENDGTPDIYQEYVQYDLSDTWIKDMRINPNRWKEYGLDPDEIL